jgi:hypothetical protein
MRRASMVVMNVIVTMGVWTGTKPSHAQAFESARIPAEKPFVLAAETPEPPMMPAPTPSPAPPSPPTPQPGPDPEPPTPAPNPQD